MDAYSSDKEISNIEQNIELTNEKGEENQNKNKLDTGMKVNNLFLLGDKYYTIGKLKKQIKDFNSLENNKKILEIIQSNEINNINEDDSNVMPVDINNSEIKKISNLNTLNIKKMKKNFVKFSQEFKNFHLSFVPMSANENDPNNNTINQENNEFFKKKIKNTFYRDKLFANKTMKNYYLITKKNKQCVKKQLNRVNSDLANYYKELPQIQNDYFNFNSRNLNKNHFSSQIYSKSNNNYYKKY